LETLKTNFISNAGYVLADNKELALAAISFKEMFGKAIVEEHDKKLMTHFDKLLELDLEYGTTLNRSGKGTYNEIQIGAAKLQILSQSRAMLVDAIAGYGNTLIEYKGQVKFRLNVTIALMALLVSVVGAIV